MSVDWIWVDSESECEYYGLVRGVRQHSMGWDWKARKEFAEVNVNENGVARKYLVLDKWVHYRACMMSGKMREMCNERGIKPVS